MLSIFRKYQRFLYIIITVVIVISFSFFGAYNGMQNSYVVDQEVFHAVNGKRVPRSELESLAMFIGTDNEDKILLGGRWGPNFLNNGVIKKDFLQTGLGPILADSFLDQLQPDLNARQQREKHYQTYQNPQAKFISAENAWNVVAPAMNQKLSEMRNVKNPASKEGFEARVNLFLEERRFPSPLLRMVLTHQQKQYQWVKPDPNLNYIDLALFGYHTVEDWFGPRFVRLVSEFIINSAILAQEKGYTVSKAEVLADLYRNAEISFQENISNPNLGAATTRQYFDEQLRRMGLDSNQAVKLWRQVMLFRRLFHDLGNSVWIDPYTIEQFQNYAKESVKGTLYQLPEALRLSDFHDLQLFEIYLSSVADRPKSGSALLELPEKFKSLDQVPPELLEKKYRLSIAKINKRDLQAKVGVKQTWEWQTKDAGWEKLKKRFPELGIKKGDTESERYAALEGLDQRTRNRVDAFSREQIVLEHPEWLNQVLSEADEKVEVVGIRKKGKNSFIAGLSDPEKLISLLDHIPESQPELNMFTADDEIYYRITVEESFPGYQVLTFAEAKEDGVLEKLLNERLKAAYLKIRESDPKPFQDQEGNWKPFEQVESLVAKQYFSPVLEAIKEYYIAVKAPGQKNKEMLPDYAATMRLFAYMRGLREQFMADPSSIEKRVVADQPQPDKQGKPAAENPLQNQWKVKEIAFHADRSVSNPPFDEQEVFKLKNGQWASVKKQNNGDFSFFRLDEHIKKPDLAGTTEKVMSAQNEFGNEAERIFMKKLVKLMMNKGALSLDYLNSRDDS